MPDTIRNEVKRTFNQITGAWKGDDKQTSTKEKELNTSKSERKQEERYKRELQKSENDLPGQILKSISTKEKTNSDMYINSSPTVRAMQLNEKDDAYKVIDELRSGQTVLVVFDEIDPSIQKSILDIIYGGCHFGHIAIEAIQYNTILIDPKLKSRQ